ncbi:MAG: peptidylprolyl isomerase [Candidatus Micrarchaeota archaeon]
MLYKLLAVLAIVFLMGCVQQSTVTPTPTAAPTIAPSDAGVPPVTTIPPGDRRVQAGDVVSVEYVGKFENGTLFDTNVQAEAEKAGLPVSPSYDLLTFTIGTRQMIPGFEAAVVGMKAGDKKTASIPPEEAYGEPSDENVMQIPVANITTGGEDVSVGMMLYATSGMSGVVTAINGSNATIDFNHPLAGKTLVFDITVKDIKRLT